MEGRLGWGGFEAPRVVSARSLPGRLPTSLLPCAQRHGGGCPDWVHVGSVDFLILCYLLHVVSGIRMEELGFLEIPVLVESSYLLKFRLSCTLGIKGDPWVLFYDLMGL